MVSETKSKMRKINWYSSMIYMQMVKVKNKMAQTKIEGEYMAVCGFCCCECRILCPIFQDLGVSSLSTYKFPERQTTSRAILDSLFSFDKFAILLLAKDERDPSKLLYLPPEYPKSENGGPLHQNIRIGANDSRIPSLLFFVLSAPHVH